jgi:hypothetical protein
MEARDVATNRGALCCATFAYEYGAITSAIMTMVWPNRNGGKTRFRKILDRC